jgi:hypothetical protein
MHIFSERIRTISKTRLGYFFALRNLVVSACRELALPNHNKALRETCLLKLDLEGKQSPRLDSAHHFASNDIYIDLFSSIFEY